MLRGWKKLRPGEIFASNISDKGLISEYIYKEFLQPKSKKQSN